jgi:membrane protein YqaA with SNARE-associated domain
VRSGEKKLLVSERTTSVSTLRPKPIPFGLLCRITESFILESREEGILANGFSCIVSKELGQTGSSGARTNYVRPIIHIIARALFRAGGVGLLTLGAFDSSPLVVPLGNDLLLLGLSARYHERMLYYAAMATAGSLLGCLATDWISRKSESAQKKLVSGKHLAYIRNQVKNRAGWALVVASLLPPPFPFTPFVAAAAAFRYPRNKLLSFIGGARFIRFVIEGALAIHYGRWIIKQAQSSLLYDVMIALIVISIVGSAFAIYQWTQGNKRIARQSE